MQIGGGPVAPARCFIPPRYVVCGHGCQQRPQLLVFRGDEGVIVIRDLVRLLHAIGGQGGGAQTGLTQFHGLLSYLRFQKRNLFFSKHNAPLDVVGEMG